MRNGENRDYSQNKFYRMAIFLPIMVFRVIRKFMYQHTEDFRYIRSLNNTKKGENCFIIGNGPSLTARDLDAISTYDSFGTNRIYAMFQNTTWRPTYYISIDNNVLNDNFESILGVKAKVKFLNYTIKRTVSDRKDKSIKFINIFSRYVLSPASYETKHIRYDVSKSFSYSYSVTGVAIQLAVYMGYENIYLIGVDNSYATTISKNGNLQKSEGVRDYFGNLESKSYTIQYVDATNSYYEALRKHASKYGTHVYNATRGGKLEVFDRINLDDILTNT